MRIIRRQDTSPYHIINESKKRLTVSEDMPGSFPYLSEGERVAMKAIERSVGKLGFDCGIRWFAQHIHKINVSVCQHAALGFKEFLNVSRAAKCFCVGKDCIWNDNIGIKCRIYCRRKNAKRL